MSNFWPSPITLDGITYPTVEHAYQAAKADNRPERERIAALATPGAVKRAGRKLGDRKALIFSQRALDQRDPDVRRPTAGWNLGPKD